MMPERIDRCLTKQSRKSPPPRKYYYIHTKMNWTNAQQYCREKHTDLATFKSMGDIEMLKPDFNYIWAWIGLTDNPKSWKEAMGNDINSWKWSATGETSKTGYQNWDVNEPNYAFGIETCVVMAPNGKWFDLSCALLHSFVCYTGKKISEFMYFIN
uniref:C-type lectin domain-containing protein n=1 Tax=Lates calcarifer TaxID=8187 RepID=A0A4W6DW10_LATCA